MEAVLRPWEELIELDAAQHCRKTFLALAANSFLPLVPLGDPDSLTGVVLSSIPVRDGNLAWEFLFSNKILKDWWLLEEIQTFRNVRLSCRMAFLLKLLRARWLGNVCIEWSQALPKAGQIIRRGALWLFHLVTQDFSGSERFRWKDGRGFHASTASFVDYFRVEMMCRVWVFANGGWR